jgi:hypothetical protein
MENRRKPASLAATLDINCDCKEIVADYLDNAFPTRAMESYWDEDGNERSRPMVDEAGNPVQSQEACGSRLRRWNCSARCRRLSPRSTPSFRASALMPWPRSPAARAAW